MADRNCFPSLKAHRKGSSAELVDQGDTWKATIVFWIIACFWNGFLSVFVFQLRDAPVGLAHVILIPFVLVGLVFLVVAAKKTLTTLRLHPGRLYVSQWPIRMGHPIDLRFQRKAKTNISFSKIEAVLSLREVAIYRVGTDTRTVTQEIWSKPLPTKKFGHTFEANCSWQVTLPTDRPASFYASNNRIEWWLKLDVYYGEAKDDSQFQILVAPEVAA